MQWASSFICMCRGLLHFGTTMLHRAPSVGGTKQEKEAGLGGLSLRRRRTRQSIIYKALAARCVTCDAPPPASGYLSCCPWPAICYRHTPHVRDLYAGCGKYAGNTGNIRCHVSHMASGKGPAKTNR
jgi:hypothetical protein